MDKQINEHIYVGELNTLKVNRVSEPEIYLISDDQTEVLLQMLMLQKIWKLIVYLRFLSTQIVKTELCSNYS